VFLLTNPKYYFNKIREKRKDVEIERELELKRKFMKTRAKSGILSMLGWGSNRGYGSYNGIFSPGLRQIGLGNNIVEAISNIPRRRNKPITILEDGPGKGRFLIELRKKLIGLKIPLRITAVTPHHLKRLRGLKRRGVLDELVESYNEDHLPKEQADVVVSLLGSINYSVPQLRKSLLLKQATTLRKGGLMMVGFAFSDSSDSIRHGLSESPSENRRMPLAKEMEGIEKALAKRGFTAKFCQAGLPPLELKFRKFEQTLGGLGLLYPDYKPDKSLYDRMLTLIIKREK